MENFKYRVGEYENDRLIRMIDLYTELPKAIQAQEEVAEEFRTNNIAAAIIDEKYDGESLIERNIKFGEYMIKLERYQ